MSDILNLEFWAFVGVVAGIYTILAAGIQLQFGFTGLLNFGQVAFMAIGAYTMAILVVKRDVNLWVAAVTGIAVAVAFGALLAMPALRLRADFLAITTVAFSEIIRYVALNEETLTGGSQGTSALGEEDTIASYSEQWKGVVVAIEGALARVSDSLATKDVAMLVAVWAAALMILALLTVVVRSPWGRILKAVRDDEDAARALGKNVFWFKLQSFMLGSAIGAVAGVAYALQFSVFSPADFEPLLTFFAWTVVLLGGTGRIWGVPLGALVFGTLFAGTRFFDFFPFSLFNSTERAYVRLMLIGLILIALVMFRPQGLLGRRQEMVLE